MTRPIDRTHGARIGAGAAEEAKRLNLGEL